ncbi:MAG: hypothetical protein QXH30_00085 [Candidatus Bilamarchaeaceae archaeon]
MLKVTLSHIGAISLGRLLAIWSFVLGLILLLIYGVISILLTLLGILSGTDVVGTIIALLISLVMGVVGLIFFGIAMFIWGFLVAVVYNIVLGVGGGIDMDFKERS